MDSYQRTHTHTHTSLHTISFFHIFQVFVCFKLIHLHFPEVAWKPHFIGKDFFILEIVWWLWNRRFIQHPLTARSRVWFQSLLSLHSIVSTREKQTTNWDPPNVFRHPTCRSQPPIWKTQIWRKIFVFPWQTAMMLQRQLVWRSRHLGKHRVVICQETLQRFTGTKTERKEEFTKTLTKAPVIPTLCNFNDFKIIIIQLILAYIYSHFEVHRNHCISLFCFLYMWHYGELRITLKLLNIYNVYP